jgi:Spy/CpxP family protein refolding chaperone
MKIRTLFLIASALFLSQITLADNTTEASGKTLFQSYCAACHGANVGGMDMSKRIAPPIVAVRMHYIDSYPDQTSFVAAISDWTEHPDTSKSLMRGAIKRFKIMPPIVAPKEDILKIATYIYAGDIEKPEGFEKHVKEEHGKAGLGKMKGHHQEDQEKGVAGRKPQHKSGHYKLMEQLNLSEQQRQGIKILMQQKRILLSPLKKEIQQLKKTIQQLDTTDTNYQAQTLILVEKKSELTRQMVIKKAEMRMKIEAILTPEQRIKLKELKPTDKR